MALRCLQQGDCLSYRIFLFGSPLTSLAPLPLKDTGRLHGSSFPDCQLVTADGVIYMFSSALAQASARPWAPVTGIQTSGSSRALSSPVAGGWGGESATALPPPRGALHNLPFGFLWAISVSDSGTV